MANRFLRRYLPRGVFWRELLASAVEVVPFFIEPLIIAIWTGFFFLFWFPGRRTVRRNLGIILRGSSPVVNFFRTYRLFWNFAHTFTDTMQFRVRGMHVDWEFVGRRNLDRLVANREGAIILTAHMGNYDLGSHLFSKHLHRSITVVRAPERDPDTQQFALAEQEDLRDEMLRVHYNVEPGAIALDLVDALRRQEIVALQGDRVVEGVSAFETTLFDRPVALPSGPFALAMATHVSIYPLFVVRIGRRRYRVITGEPIRCERTGRDRNADIGRAIDQWRVLLEATIHRHWHQWFTFEPFTVE
ncbi:MAG TPA: lysophospholipid acyltransferase family protein [Thermoanaerobaculia bacterium]